VLHGFMAMQFFLRLALFMPRHALRD
jgi:hypothetical protein